MTDEKMLALIKKQMSTWNGRTKWWQIKTVYKKYRQCRWSRWDSFKEILLWWWRLFPLSVWGRMRHQSIRLEEKIACNELDEIQKLFGLDVGLYMLADALKKKFGRQ